MLCTESARGAPRALDALDALALARRRRVPQSEPLHDGPASVGYTEKSAALGRPASAASAFEASAAQNALV